MKVVYSDIESRRFGMKIFRGQYEEFIWDDVKKITDNSDYDVIIVRYPTNTIYEHYHLFDLSNCKILHTDSLVYYSAALQKIDIKPLRNNLEFEKLDSNTAPQLDEIVEAIFTNYQNHYYANPCFQREQIIEGYLEWAKSLIQDNSGFTWLIKDKDSMSNVSFLACSYDKTNSTSELKLGGVLPNYAGRGIYTDFVNYAQSYFKKKGIEKLITSTQLQNIAVQRVWQKLGFIFEKSYETYHIISNNRWK